MLFVLTSGLVSSTTQEYKDDEQDDDDSAADTRDDDDGLDGQVILRRLHCNTPTHHPSIIISSYSIIFINHHSSIKLSNNSKIVCCDSQMSWIFCAWFVRA